MNSAVNLDEVNRELYARNAELAARNKTLSLLRKIDDITLTALETGDMTRKIAGVLAKEFYYPFVAVAVRERSGRKLIWQSVACLDRSARLCHISGDWKPIPLTKIKNACVRCLRTSRPAVVERVSDVIGESVTAQTVALIERAGEIKDTLLFPLSADKSVIGILVVGLNRRATELSRYERDTFSSLLNLVTIAIQKAQTYSSLLETTLKLRSANRKLKELDALKTEFLSIATHQLRTPLAVTKGYIAMLEGGMLGKLNPKQKQTVRTVEQSNEQLILLVNHLLDLTRIESGRLQVRPEPVVAQELITWTVDFLRPRALEKHLTLDAKLSTVPPVMADPEKLKEVLMNLIDNALKYTEAGGVTISLDLADGRARISVKDTGYGLTASDKARMFEMFSTGSASKHVKTTSGVGLYVCRKILEAMGGDIMAESKGKGRGSTFTVTLPLVQSKS